MDKMRKRKWRTYDMTMNDIAQLHKRQGGKCANIACRAVIPPFGRGRAVDHDPRTGGVRGMLCKACNIGLGCFQDNPRRLAGMLAYLGTISENVLTGEMRREGGASIVFDMCNGFTCTIAGAKPAVAYVVDLVCHAPDEKWCVGEQAGGVRSIGWADDYAKITESDKII